jgi:hypothetical protein
MFLYLLGVIVPFLALCRGAPLVTYPELPLDSPFEVARFSSFRAKRQNSITGPVIPINFPDPAVIPVDGTYHAFSTASAGINVQHASRAADGTWVVSGQDSLPNPGPWATGNDIWAPDVVRLVSGSNDLLSIKLTEPE